jgi:hypothetical protein
MDKVEALLYILAKTDVQDEIIRLNQEEQLVKQNVFSDGAKTPEYSEGYYNLKKRFFPQTGRNMNFRLTGDFFGTFDINILSNGDIEISANGDKGDRDLFEVYGIEILGLTEESKESLIPLFEEYLLEYVTAKMEGTYKN